MRKLHDIPLDELHTGHILHTPHGTGVIIDVDLSPATKGECAHLSVDWGPEYGTRRVNLNEKTSSGTDITRRRDDTIFVHEVGSYKNTVGENGQLYLLPCCPIEPFFTLRGRDPAAVVAIQAWIDERKRLIANGLLPDSEEERNHLHKAGQKLQQIRNWQPKRFGNHE